MRSTTLGHTARAALSGLQLASELCVHLSQLSVLSVHLNDLCLELLHRQDLLDWDNWSCGQRRLMDYCSGRLACCSGGRRLAYAGIRRCHRINF